MNVTRSAHRQKDWSFIRKTITIISTIVGKGSLLRAWCNDPSQRKSLLQQASWLFQMRQVKMKEKNTMRVTTQEKRRKKHSLTSERLFPGSESFVVGWETPEKSLCFFEVRPHCKIFNHLLVSLFVLRILTAIPLQCFWYTDWFGKAVSA